MNVLAAAASMDLEDANEDAKPSAATTVCRIIFANTIIILTTTVDAIVATFTATTDNNNNNNWMIKPNGKMEKRRDILQNRPKNKNILQTRPISQDNFLFSSLYKP
jgi:hypothetical protein